MKQLLWIGLLFACSGLSHADVGLGAGTDLFRAGRTRLSLTAGLGRQFDKDYGVLGAGIAYYVWDRIEAGVDGEAWIGQKPHIYNVTPAARYVFPFQFGQATPYVGGFYRRTFYDTLKDLDSAGARAGAFFPFGRNFSASAGLVYEKLFNCDKTLYSSCSSVYPEVGLFITF